MAVLRGHAQIKLSRYYNSKKPIENQGEIRHIIENIVVLMYEVNDKKNSAIAHMPIENSVLVYLQSDGFYVARFP